MSQRTKFLTQIFGPFKSKYWLWNNNLEIILQDCWTIIEQQLLDYPSSTHPDPRGDAWFCVEKN